MRQSQTAYLHMDSTKIINNKKQKNEEINRESFALILIVLLRMFRSILYAVRKNIDLLEISQILFNQHLAARF